MQGRSRLDSQGLPGGLGWTHTDHQVHPGNAENSLLSKTGSPVVTFVTDEFPINYSRAEVEQVVLRITGSQ